VLRAHPNKAELARRLGVDRKTLWRYATGARPIPPHLLPRILTPAPRSPDADPDQRAGTRTGPEHPRRQATQAAQTRRRRARRTAGGRADPPGHPLGDPGPQRGSGGPGAQ